MTATSTGHGRAQNLLLVSKLLDCRDNISPFTLILDSLEQTARHLIQNYIQRCKASRTAVIFVSFETLRPPADVQQIIRAYAISSSQLQSEIKAIADVNAQSGKRCLVVFDTLHPLISNADISIAGFLSGVIAPNVGLLCVYHTDMPGATHLSRASTYGPDALTLLKFLATSVLTIHSFAHVLDEKAAKDRSIVAPSFGLQEAIEGVIQGLGSQDLRGSVIEMEHRRRSGRSVHAVFFLANDTSVAKQLPILLLDAHPLYAADAPDKATQETDTPAEVSFNLSLTEKQRRDRDNIILPYFDAQNDAAAPGEGGRILYDMGAEDDFDEEEDEI